MRPCIFLWGRAGRYPNYLRAMEAAGAAVLASEDPADSAGCGGLLLPGGGDLDPWRYGQADTACRDVDPARDQAELALLERFVSAGMPVLGICRGMQVINVFFGGTLAQDVPGHGQAGGIDRLHRLRSAPSPLRDLTGQAPVVNSAHHQAADRLGAGLTAVQWTPDGVAEALLHRSLPVWGVQYHPERLAGPLSRRGAADGGCLLGAWVRLCRPSAKKRRETKFDA